MNDHLIIAAVTEIRRAIPTDAPLETRLRVAFEHARDHWLVTDEEARFRAGCVAVLLTYAEGSPERARIEGEMLALSRFSAALTAAQAGLGVDWQRALPAKPEYESIGLLKLWREQEAPQGPPRPPQATP